MLNPTAIAIALAVVLASLGAAYFKGRADGGDAIRAAYVEAAEIQRRAVRGAEQRSAEAVKRLAEAREALSAAERRARKQGPSSALSEAQSEGLADVLRGD